MNDLNKVFLLGNLTRDPELRYTPSGQAVCNLGIAVNREFKGKDDNRQKETTFLTVVVWGKSGEACGTHLKKGRPVLVEGRLQSRSWEGKDGQKNKTIEVVADNVRFLGGREEQRGGRSSEPQAPNVPDDGSEDDIPF